MKKISPPKKVILLALLLLSYLAEAQDVTLGAFPSPVFASSPLVGGAVDQRIFAFRLSKGGGGSNTITQLIVNANVADVSVQLVSAQLFLTSNSTVVSSGSNAVISGNTITFNPNGTFLTNFGNESGPEIRDFYVEVTVQGNVTTSTPAITLSLAAAGITDTEPTAAAPAGTTQTGSAFSFVDLKTTLTQNTDAGAVVAGNTNIELMDFSALSNGSQSITSPLVFTFNKNVTSLLTGFDLIVEGVDIDGAETYNLSGDGLTLSIENFDAEDVSSAKNFILRANIPSNAPTDNFIITLASTGLTPSPGIIEPFTAFTNTVSITALGVGITQNTDTNDATAGATNIELLDFNALSNGAQSIVSPIVFNFSVDVSSTLSNFELLVDGGALAGTPVYTPSNGGQTLTITGFTAINVSTAKNFIFYADVDGNAGNASDFNVTLANAGLAASPGIVNSFTTLSNTVDISSLQTSVTQNTDTDAAVAGTTSVELLDFSLSSNGNQNFQDPLVITFDKDVNAIFSNFSLTVNGADIDAGETYTLSPDGLTLTINNFADVSLNAVDKIIRLQANIPLAAPTTNDIIITLATAGLSISPGGKGGFVSISNTFDVTAVSATITQITATPVVAGTILEAGANDIVLTGFSVTSNGTLALNDITFNLTNTAGRFSNFELFRSTTINTLGVSIDTDGSAAFTGLGESINTGTTYYYYLVADVNASLTTATTPTADVTLTDANVVFNIDNDNVISFTRNFSFTQSSSSTVTKVATSEEATFDYAEYSAHTATSNLTDGGTDNLMTIRITDSDTDNQPTIVNAITFTLTNFNNLATVALFDGTTRLAEAPAAASVSFTGLTASVTDNTTKDLNIRTTFAGSVTDNANIGISVTSVTVDNTKSLLSGFSAINSDPTRNRIDVDATRTTFDAIVGTIIPAADFTVTVRATDALFNLDTDETTSVTLEKVSGPGAISFGAQTAARSFVAGVVSWSQVELSLAGDYQLRANGSLTTDGTINLAVTSLGVAIVGPVNQSFCFGGGFETLNNIVITESDPSDFSAGNGQTYSIILPSNFIFDQTATPSVTETSGGSDNVTGFGATSYPSANIFRFTYSVTGIDQLDQITIGNLRVRYTGTSAVTGQTIFRIGGTAGQAGNADTDAEPHGTLSAGNGATDVTFINSGGQPLETAFGINSSAITLQGKRISDDANITGVFSGVGVSLDNDGFYKFNPSQLAAGSNYVITFTYTDPIAPNCQSIASKTYEVFSSLINNLNTEYCINDPQSGILTVNFFPGGTCLNASLETVPAYQFFDFVYLTNPSNFNSGSPLPTPNNRFTPSDPIYQNLIDTYGYIRIGYRVTFSCAAIPTPFLWNFVDVAIKQKPNISFNPTLAPNFCAYDAPITLTPNVTIQNNAFDEFYGSAVGAPGTPQAGISGSFGSGFTFNPATANASSSPVQLQINFKYRDPNTTCTNEVSKVVTINPQPAVVPDGNITSRLVAGNVDPEFCKGETITAFSASNIFGTTYRWYSDNGATVQIGLGNNFIPPVDNNTVATTPFYVTRTILGCESDVTALSVSINDPAVAEAGNDQITCAGNDIDLTVLGASVSGSAVAANSTWEVQGGTIATIGQFRNVSNSNITDGSGRASFALATTYVPSATDIAAGFVIFVLTTNDPAGPCGVATDVVRVTINSVATSSAGANQIVCAGDAINLNGIISGSTGATWSTNGLGSFLPSPTSLIASYIPDASETANGANLTITLTTDDPAGPCTAVASNFTLTINRRPTVNAGANVTICEGSPLLISSLTGANIGAPATTGEWSLTTGVATGDFRDATNSTNFVFGQATTYLPSPADISAGSVTLRLTTNDSDGPSPVGPCPTVFDDVVITINRAAQVSAGNDIVVCSGDVIELVEASTGGATTPGDITWTENGQGTVTDDQALFTRYTPSVSELTTGATITFTLTSDDPDGVGPTGPCPSVSDNLLVTINRRAFVEAGPNIEVCANETINLLGSFPASSAASQATWSGGTGSYSPLSLISNGGATAVSYQPSATELSGGAIITLTLTSDDGDGGGPCPVETDQTTITINPIPVEPLAASPPDYCVNQAVLPLTATGSNLKWYDNAVLIPANQRGVGASFPSGVIADAAKEVNFFVTQTSLQGCESPSTLVIITVNPLPVPDFNATNYCLNDAMTFTDLSTIPAGSIVEWSWRFDDGDELPINSGAIPAGTHNDRTTGSFNAPSHIYSSIGNYNIRLLARSSEGCENSIVKPFSVGPIPIADFTFQNVCEDQSTNFNYSFSPGVIVLRDWNFGDINSGTTNLFSDNTISPPGIALGVNHEFSAVGTYNVSLKLTTNLGCENEIIKTVSILPYVQDEYTESFESANHGWASEGLNTNGSNSWNITIPFAEEVTSAFEGNQFWITRDPNLSPPTYALNERSVLYTPCFNVNNISRPVISFYYWNDTDLRSDGAYIESSVDSGLTWQRFGNLTNGQNWYNTAGISGLANQNGVGQSLEQMGWSGQTGNWVNARLSLNTFASNTRVRFRFVFGSNADANLTETNNGFALDAFSVSTRNRILLAENFTNMANATTATANNSSFRNFNSTLDTDELIKIQYHTGFGGDDEIYSVNSADPDARAAFYGITSSFSGHIDGKSQGTFTGSWVNTEYNKRSLDVSPLTIDLVTLPDPDNSLNIEAVVHVDQNLINNINPNSQYVIHIGVLEKTVNNETFVLRKLLPSASGTPLTSLTAGSTQTVNVSYQLTHVENPNNMAIVAFVQDLTSQNQDGVLVKEILQAKMLSSVAPPINIVTDLEKSDEVFSIYPNPADRDLIVSLPEIAAKQTQVVMFDQMGKVVREVTFEKGEHSKQLDTETLSAGVYLIKVETSKGMLMKKVVITHR